MNYGDNFFKWVDGHLKDDVMALRLKFSGRKDADFDYDFAIVQIECLRRFGKKLESTLSRCPCFLFPSVVAGEQSTSDMLADYHREIVGEVASVADFTAGLGIDVFTIAPGVQSAVAVELDAVRAEVLRYNVEQLQLDNVTVVEGDCRDYARRCEEAGTVFDVIFIDPARRADDGSRVYALNDCQPDIVEMFPVLRRICKRLVVKASPMLDVSHTVGLLPLKPAKVILLGNASECKELLLDIDMRNDRQRETEVVAVTLTGKGDVFRFPFRRDEEASATMPEYASAMHAGAYIYEPYPSLMKAGAYKLVAVRFGLQAVAPNTHLYYGRLCDDFPGYRYRILEILPFASRVIKRLKGKYPKINVAVRNFGMSADVLRKRLGVADGGDLRLYGFTDARGERMLAIVSKA